MTGEDRLKWIDVVALAIRTMSAGRLHSQKNAEKINHFAEGLRLMAKMPDGFIERNKAHFDEIRAEAESVNNGE